MVSFFGGVNLLIFRDGMLQGFRFEAEKIVPQTNDDKQMRLRKTLFLSSSKMVGESDNRPFLGPYLGWGAR